jgi:hypothetical protein
VVVTVVRGRRGLSFGWVQERKYAASRAAVFPRGSLYYRSAAVLYCTISLVSLPLHNTSSYIRNERMSEGGRGEDAVGVLTSARYGKDKVRVFRVVRDATSKVHDVVEYNVTVLVEGAVDTRCGPIASLTLVHL